MNATNIIVDASIIIKWLLPDEEDTVALKIKQDFEEKLLTISVPHIIYYEIGNVLKTAIIRNRIKRDEAKKLYRAFIDLEFITYAMKDLLSLALIKSLENDISFYDASYIALSEYLQIKFLTADQKLLNKVKSKLVIDLKNY